MEEAPTIEITPDMEREMARSEIFRACEQSKFGEYSTRDKFITWLKLHTINTVANPYSMNLGYIKHFGSADAESIEYRSPAEIISSEIKPKTGAEPIIQKETLIQALSDPLPSGKTLYEEIEENHRELHETTREYKETMDPSLYQKGQEILSKLKALKPKEPTPDQAGA